MARVSLKDIATSLEVSESLVSKVLSGRMGTTGANPEVVKAIRRKARQLGYRRNRTASALAAGRQGVIAVFVHQHGEPGSNIVEDFMVGVADRSAEEGQRLWLQFFHTRDEFLAKAGDIHLNEVDGLIVTGPLHYDLVPDFLAWQEDGLPVVTVYAAPVDDRLINIGCEDERLTHLAAGHLIEQGCQRLATLDTQPMRTQGFIAACRARGLEIDPRLIVKTDDFGYQSAARSLRQLLASGTRFDGIVGQSDHHALAAVHLLLEKGLAVPGQVRVIGIDNSPVCMMSPVVLSSISQRFEERGRLAVSQLLASIDRRAGESLMLPPLLHRRQSS